MPAWYRALVSDLLVLMTWTTANREALLNFQVAAHLVSLFPILAAKAGARLLELSIVSTHVHAVLALPVAFDLPRVAQQLKGASARRVNADHHLRRVVRWANGYDVRSISRRNLPDVCRYLDRQGEHHATALLARWSVARAAAGPSGPGSAEHGPWPVSRPGSWSTHSPRPGPAAEGQVVG